MTAPGTPPPPGVPERRSSGGLVALTTVVGVILTMFAITFAIGALGIWLIRAAFRPPGR